MGATATAMPPPPFALSWLELAATAAAEKIELAEVAYIGGGKKGDEERK